MLPQGWIAGQWVWGTTVYVATLLTVLLKAALISESVYSPADMTLTQLITPSSIQSLDKVYRRRDSWIIRIYHGVPAVVSADSANGWR
jgi:hypothetical protein